jgi:hypothetical protein
VESEAVSLHLFVCYSKGSPLHMGAGRCVGAEVPLISFVFWNGLLAFNLLLILFSVIIKHYMCCFGK